MHFSLGCLTVNRLSVTVSHSCILSCCNSIGFSLSSHCGPSYHLQRSELLQVQRYIYRIVEFTMFDVPHLRFQNCIIEFIIRERTSKLLGRSSRGTTIRRRRVPEANVTVPVTARMHALYAPNHRPPCPFSSVLQLCVSKSSALASLLHRGVPTESTK